MGAIQKGLPTRVGIGSYAKRLIDITIEQFTPAVNSVTIFILCEFFKTEACAGGLAVLTVCLSLHSYLGTTVFRRMQNFEPSCRICPFPRNFYVFTEFCGIRF